MAGKPKQPDELRRLIALCMEDRATEEEREQLNRLIAEDDEALESVCEQLEVEALLQWHHGNVNVTANSERALRPAASRRASRRRIIYWTALATALLIAIAMWGVWRGNQPAGEIVKPVDPIPEPRPAIKLAAVWKIEATSDAQYEMLDPYRINLTRGELYVYSNDAEAQRPNERKHPPLNIETPAGRTVAAGTHFYVGTHFLEGDSMNPFTRVLVLSGMVTLINSMGSVTGAANDLLAAEAETQPVNLTVQANSEFAIDLYRRLSQENEGGNLFFSPYSINNALLMAMEGARGETADEMGRALHFPEEARRIGDDRQLIPWRTSLIHSGMAEIQQRLTPADTPETVRLRKEIASLQAALNDANQRAVKLFDQKKRRESFEATREARAVAKKLNALLPQVDRYELEVANAIWAEKTYGVRQPFIDTVNKFYEVGGVFPVDFRNRREEARNQINDWIANKTNHRIENMVPSDAISPMTKMVLANAVYFRGDWAKPFEEKNTSEQPFTLSDGREVQVPLMFQRSMRGVRYGALNGDGSSYDTPRRVPRKREVQTYPGEDGFALLEMPYKGRELSMVFIAPNKPDGLDGVEKQLTREGLNDWLGNLQRRKTHVYIPKFRLDENTRVQRTLKAMGMVRAFTNPADGDGADFSGISSSSDPLDQLYISQILHKAFIDVTEKGTEAAAATVIVAEPSAAAPEETVPFTPIFKADRPFLFLIRDSKTGTILFMGRMAMPSGAQG